MSSFGECQEERDALEDSGTELCGGGQWAHRGVSAVKGSQDYVLNKANMSFTGLKVGAGAGACVPPAAVPAPAVPQRKQTTLHTSSGGFIPARGLEMQPDGETTASLQPSQEALLFGKLGDEITEKEFEGCSTIYNTGMVPCAL